MKAILIMDMPSSCDMCELASLVGKGEVMCAINRMETRKYEDACKDKPDWCPLKSVPEKKDEHKVYTMTQLYRAQGFNACIDEILGDKE